MILSGTSITRSALEFATPACRLGVRLSATRIFGKSRHLFHAYKSCHRVCRTTGKSRSGPVHHLRVRRRARTEKWSPVGARNLGYNKRLRSARYLPPGRVEEDLCRLISSCPRWASLFLREPLQSG